MRVAALIIGVIAGLVASLIIALGGLGATAILATPDDRQAQVITFGLLIVGNIGVFGAALVLASPIAGAILLLVGAVAWVGAALLGGYSSIMALIVPPVLLLLGAILAGIAHFRRVEAADEDGDEDQDDDPDVEIIAPASALRRPSRQSEPVLDEDDEDVRVPGFAAEPRAATAPRFDERPEVDDDWNPRRRPPPPPRAKTNFRAFDEEDEDDEYDEPRGFARFAAGLSGVLSFGLYAALAGAVLLFIWNAALNRQADDPAAVVAEIDSGQPDETPAPLASVAPAPQAPAAPVLSPVSEQPVAARPTQPQAELAPRQPIANDFLTDGVVRAPQPAESPTPLEPAATAPPPAATAALEPAPLAETPPPAPEPQQASIPAAGQPFPMLPTAAILAQRERPAPAPAAAPAASPVPLFDTGLQ